jgi:hypothetical protein
MLQMRAQHHFCENEHSHMFPSTWTLESETNLQNSRIVLDLIIAFLDLSSRLQNLRQFEQQLAAMLLETPKH